MSSVMAEYVYADGERVTLMIDLDEDVLLLLPDALTQAKDVAVAGVRELTGIGVEELEIPGGSDG